MQPLTKRARLDPADAAAAVCQPFRLPRELLELVATYFSRREAAPVMAVSSVFYEIFAERVWRRLDTYLADGKTIPLKSLVKHGHLVRHMRITKQLRESIDLAATFPNVTHLRIPLTRLADTVESSQGKCFERLNWLSTWGYASNPGKIEILQYFDPVLSWIDSRLETEAGLEKIEWKVYDSHDTQLSHKLLKWFQCNGQLSRVHFKLANKLLNFGNTQKADFYTAIPHCLVDLKIEDDYVECSTERFSRILKSISPAKRQNFTFPVLKSLRIGTCCGVDNKVYSQFNFGKLFPSVRDLALDSRRMLCSNRRHEGFVSVFANPWPSVRKLDIYGASNFKNTISRLTAVSNVEELSLNQEAGGEYEDMGIVNLCELDHALPKLVRLKVRSHVVASDTQQSQQQRRQMLRHLRHVTLELLVTTSSAFRVLAQAPLLTDICLKSVWFRNDDNVEVSNELDVKAYYQLDLADNVDFLAGVTSTTVRSVDICNGRSHLPVNYGNIIRAMLKCFVRLGVCNIRTKDKKDLPGLAEEFPIVKFKYIK